MKIYITNLLTNFNYGINFYLYIISGKHIRKELMRRHTMFFIPKIKHNVNFKKSGCCAASYNRLSKNNQQHGSNVILATFETVSSV